MKVVKKYIGLSSTQRLSLISKLWKDKKNIIKYEIKFDYNQKL